MNLKDKFVKDIPCPKCKGTGKIKNTQYLPEIRKKAQQLRDKGLTYRAIADKLGITHPQSIKSMINKVIWVKK